MPGLILTYTWLAALLVTGPMPGNADGPAPADGAPSESAADAVPAAHAGAVATPDRVADSALAGRHRATGSDTARPVRSAATDPAAPAVQDPAVILRRTSAAYESMDALRADFSQTLRNTLLGRTTESAGTLYQREPDRFLMDFSDPEGDLIVSDGRYFWMYFPSVDERQVLRAPRRGQGLDLHTQFIGDPVERFAYEYQGTEPVRGREAHVFTLDPREPAGYERMKVWIDAEDYLVRRFELHEENGNVRHLELYDMVVNPTLADRLFEFTPPENAIVVDRG